MSSSSFYILCILAVIYQFACQPARTNEEIVYEEEVFDESISYASLGLEKLSEYGFFTGKLVELIPAENVFPYDLNSPLFSDYALKKRFIYIPEGGEINYHETEVLDFPIGTVLIKNFYYDDAQLADKNGRIIETRLLIKEAGEWVALPYLWNVDQTEAELEITGGELEVFLAGKKPINYQMPNMGQCKGCHERNGKIEPIGPSARQLNRKNIHKDGEYNQLTRLQDLGLLKNLPEMKSVPKLAAWNKSETGSLDDRSRAYLEINCAHCHRKEGPAKNSGLHLMALGAESQELGIMKAPIAAGHGSGNLKYDVVPGKPDESIMIHRMNSTEASTMMPELGRKLIHKEGVELIREWIMSLEE